MTAKKSAPKF
jgi:tetratricopeptide (TPR) repeat protein